MKTLLSLALITLITVTSYAQPGKRRGAGQGKMAAATVDASQVPDAVKNAFAATGATAMRWEKHDASGKGGKSYVKYVAVYNTADGIRARARYKEDGTALTSSKYMRTEKLPANIQSAAAAKANGQKVMGGEEIKTKDGKTFYRVVSRGGGSRTVTVFDGDGKEVTRGHKNHEEVMESEGEDDGNKEKDN